jgi:hypothetical protein
MNIHDYNTLFEHDKTRYLNPYSVENSAFYEQICKHFGQPELVFDRYHYLKWGDIRTNTQLTNEGMLKSWHLPWKTHVFEENLKSSDYILAAHYAKDLRDGTAAEKIASGKYFFRARNIETSKRGKSYLQRVLDSVRGENKEYVDRWLTNGYTGGGYPPTISEALDTGLKVQKLFGDTQLTTYRIYLRD